MSASSEPASGPPNPSSPSAESAQLSVPQQAALSALFSGKLIRDAAAASGVHRVTVGRWLRSDPAFRAAYNAWRQELIDSTHTRLLRTAELATGAIHRAIAQGDGRLALMLLDRLGLASPRAASADPPDAPLALDEIALEGAERHDVLDRRLKAVGKTTLFLSDQTRLNDLRRETAKAVPPRVEPGQ
jgi:hypothetical protein